MIAQIILTVGLSMCLFYIISLGRTLPLVRFGLLCVVLAGYVFIWFPEMTNTLADLVGIGRGADLVMYLWILISLFMILKLHIKLREHSESLTILARKVALIDLDNGE
jgi:hypothetical protein